MKLLRVAFIAMGVAAATAGYSQTDTTRNPTDTIRPGKPDTTMMSYGYNGESYTSINMTNVADTVKPDTARTSYGYENTTTTPGVTEANSTSQTQVIPQPNFGRYYIPVLGSYTSSAQGEEQNRNVTIQGDEQNPGKIWIEGLTAEKIYAVRKANAGTYKIPAQKVNDNNIPEGTLLYDDNSKEVRICLGHKYVDSNPSEVFTTQTEEVPVKKNKKMAGKTAVINFTGTKTEAGTAKM